MRYDPPRHHRHSIRIRNYDYSRPGAYSITFNTLHRENLFGEVKVGVMHLNIFGGIVSHSWHCIPEHFPNVELDEFVVMPDHVYGRFIIIDDDSVVATHAPTKT